MEGLQEITERASICLSELRTTSPLCSCTHDTGRIEALQQMGYFQQNHECPW